MKVSNSYRYILIVIDVYTLFFVCASLANKRSSTVKNALLPIFEKYGKPERMETDAGMT